MLKDPEWRLSCWRTLGVSATSIKKLTPLPFCYHGVYDSGVLQKEGFLEKEKISVFPSSRCIPSCATTWRTGLGSPDPCPFPQKGEGVVFLEKRRSFLLGMRRDDIVVNTEIRVIAM